jgi:peptide/nickel transport system substrate-binding protein|tara:strand:- start:37 stop:1587 length:1551 start_codon:yes stop_codon:yes gene_type:complete
MEETMKIIKSTIAAAVALALAGPALAQKSKDTIRLSLDEQIPKISTYHWPVGEAGQFYRRVYQGLMAYDEYEGKFVPALATSWKRINDTTIEFNLRKGVKFHNGNPFDADDVINTFAYVGSPKVKLRFKSRYNWVKEVQKLGSHKIRVVAKKTNAMDMALLAFRLLILDSKVHKKLDKKSDYGRVSAAGTGVVKIFSVDRNKGVVAGRNDAFNSGERKYFPAPAKRVIGIHLPDNQTKIAQLISGGVDMVRNISPDNAKALANHPNLEVSYLKSNFMVFFAIDSAGVSGNKALADVRVRKAIWMSMDRDVIIKHIVPGGSRAQKMKALCFKSAAACKWTKDAPPFDPAQAKRLLAEAGYPNGIDFTFHVISRIKEIGEAMAGEMRKVGVRAKVQPTNIGTYRRLQGQKKLQAWLIAYPAGSFPDAGNHLNVYFRGSRTQYMGADPIILGAMKKGAGELNLKKRAEFYSTAYDRANEMIYNMAVTSLPYVIAHTKDVKVGLDSLSTGEIYVNNYGWK